MNDDLEDHIYAEAKPDVEALKTLYEETFKDLSEFMGNCDTWHDDRRNIWAGKSPDFRKKGVDAFPWQNASDQEVYTIDERISTYVSLCMTALSRSHIKAFPTSAMAAPRSGVVSQFLKWMRSDYIKNFSREMEMAANNLFEKGIAITYCGWEKKQSTYLQLITTEQLEQVAPDIVQMIVEGNDDEYLIVSLIQIFPSVSKKRARKAISDFRKNGSAEIPVVRNTVDRPLVRNCKPNGEVFFPKWARDPQSSPYVFWKVPLTPQELKSRIFSEGFDAAWVDYAIENCKGDDKSKLVNDELIYVVYCFQRLIDKEDGSEGIYVSVFHKDAPGLAMHTLLNGFDDYPFVVTKLYEDDPGLYESRSFCQILRSQQFQIKVERDSRVDRASISTNPPLEHPAGRPPAAWGPGVKVGYRRRGETGYAEIPPPPSGSVEVEASITSQADKAVGLDLENPLSASRQQFIIGKFLDHAKQVLEMSWKMYKRVGPDEVFFQVSGDPSGRLITKGDADEDFTISLNFDTQSNDPERAEVKLTQMATLLGHDRNNRIDIDKHLEFWAATIDPAYADYVLQPKEQGQEQIGKYVTDDITKIYSGVEMPARPNGAQAALQLISAYASQPDITAKLQTDEAFAARLQKYAEQYQFQITQTQNAEIGKTGTIQANMAGVSTQNINQ